MNAGERIYNVIRGKKVDRLPIIEWAPFWHLTWERWCKDGLNLPYNIFEMQRHLGLDGCIQTYFPATGPDTPHPAYHGAGILKTEKEYAVIKKTLYPDPSKMYPKEHYEWVKKTHAEGHTAHWFTVSGFFWFPRDMFGIEPHLYSFYDEPELLHLICRDYAVWVKKVIEFVGNTFKFDFMSFAEDMSYNNGPMLGKDAFDEFLAPYYKEVIPYIKKLDIPVMLDSDGDITKAVGWYAGVGAEGMFPLERQAGVDVSLYIKEHPGIAFLGHYDKMIMHRGEAALRTEFERLLPSMKKGRFLPSVDHQTPPDVSLENYKTYVRLFKEYAVKACK